jgi:RNA recognition motif-containing protein
MGTRLFVGNLSNNVSQSDLEAFFAQAGGVREVTIPTDRETGQPRGFGFVTMLDTSAANAAMSQLNGATLDGRALRVNEAQERPQRSGSGGARGGGRRY